MGRRMLRGALLILALAGAACTAGDPEATPDAPADAPADAVADAAPDPAGDAAPADDGRPADADDAEGPAPGGCGQDCEATVTVPATTFRMGCDESKDPSCPDRDFGMEVPSHEVKVPAFTIDRYEVTASRYAACLAAGQCTAPRWDSRYCNLGKPGREQHPMNCLDWNQAQAVCRFTGRRLCSEAEWELAARGTTGREYPWGDDAPDCSRAILSEGGHGCGADQTWPVGSRPAGASPYGVQDMAGNVWEWVKDLYHDNYEGAPADGSPWLNDECPDEGGKDIPSGCYDRMVRGGSFVNVGSFLRSSLRYDFDHSFFAGYYLGVRCCGSP